MTSTGLLQLYDQSERDASGVPERTIGAADSTSINEPIDLRTFWLTLRWRAGLIVAIVLGTLALAVAALIVVPPKYEATTLVMVDSREPHVTETPTVLPGIGNDPAAVESQVEIITSSALARQVALAMNLQNDPEFSMPSLRDDISDILHKLVDRPDTRERTGEERLISKVQDNLMVHRRAQTYVLEIDFLSKDADKAARIANGFAQAYLGYQQKIRSDTTAQAFQWLDARMEDMRARVRQSDEAVENFRSTHNIVDVTQGNKLINRQIEDLTQQIALARAHTADSRARMEQAEYAVQHNDDPAALNEALQSSVIAELRAQYASISRTEAQDRMNYGEKYPGMTAVHAQLADVRRQINDEIARILASVRNDYQTALGRENALEDQLAKLKQQFAVMDQAEVKLHELERDAQADRDLFGQFLNRAKQTAEQQSIQIADAHVIAAALPPLKPNRPPMSLLLGAATGGGLLLAVALVLMMEHTRQGFRSLREAAQYLSVPGLGMLPRQSEDSAGGSRRLRSKAHAGRPACRFAVSHPRSVYARQVYAICSRLFEAMSTNKIVTVASATSGEGKSTLACNIALAAAECGVRTLLIDGDIYTGRLTRLLELGDAGLCDVLDDKIPLAKALTKDTDTGLYILGAWGRSRAKPPENFAFAKLESLLSYCRKEFDLVVLDSPAILSVGGITPHLKWVDGAVLVGEWNRTPRQAMAETVELLDTQRLKIVGLVLNKVSLRWYRLFHYGARYQQSSVATSAAV